MSQVKSREFSMKMDCIDFKGCWGEFVLKALPISRASPTRQNQSNQDNRLARVLLDCLVSIIIPVLLQHFQQNERSSVGCLHRILVMNRSINSEYQSYYRSQSIIIKHMSYLITCYGVVCSVEDIVSEMCYMTQGLGLDVLYRAHSGLYTETRWFKCDWH